MGNKFDDEKIKKVNLMNLSIDDLNDLMTAKYEVEIENNCYCGNCRHIFYNDVSPLIGDEKIKCPNCGETEDVYTCYQDDIDMSNVDDLEDDLGREGVTKMKEVLKKIESKENLSASNKITLEEATIKALYDELPAKEYDEVEGIVDDILVVTDPEISKDEYDELIDRAQELVEDTPEGEIPMDEDYINMYLLTCPICGTTFISEEILQPGATCPICYEVPDSFVVKGKIESEEEVAEDNNVKPKNSEEELSQGTDDIIPSNSDEEPTEEDEEEPREERQVASEQIQTSANKLQENVETITEDLPKDDPDIEPETYEAEKELKRKSQILKGAKKECNCKECEEEFVEYFPNE